MKRFSHTNREKNVDGLDVFLTVVDGNKIAKTVPAVLKPIGQVVFGASLDPDAEDCYDVAAGFQAECQPVLEGLSGRSLTHFKIWRNSAPMEGADTIEVFQDAALKSPISISVDEPLTVEVEWPTWFKDMVFQKAERR
jgi:hypothetical protein